MSNSNQLPVHIAQQLEDLRGTIRGCDAAIAQYWNLEKWELREFVQVRDETIAKLAAWEASIAISFAA